MLSSDEPVENAWMRAHARCECRRGSHHHGDRCTHDLVWEHRGWMAHRGAWEAHHKSPRVRAGWEAVKHVEILCWECFQQVWRAGLPALRVPPDRAAPAVGPRGAEPEGTLVGGTRGTG
jgi:hypothetical protein